MNKNVGFCESCGNKEELQEVPSSQPGNKTVHKYCDNCAFLDEKEKIVQGLLKDLSKVDIEAANDPQKVSDLHQQVSKELLS